jgi:4,5-DOPA dioxygenase extradiol
MAQRMPAIFFGHGNPMNALRHNEWTAAWANIGKTIPRPLAVLCISAHWYVPAILINGQLAPRLIYDFGGFPPELYQVHYPASGDPMLARRVSKLLAPLRVPIDSSWGLDHGTWSVFRHVYPAADVPIVQLSIDETQPAVFHFELGRQLAPLRDQGILIAGSGNLVHNLHTYAWGEHMPEPFDWAIRFEALAKGLMSTGNSEPLINYESLGRDALMSIPTPDHYLPLLYVLGTQQKDEAVSFPVKGVDGGSVSMLAVRVG